MPPTFRTRLWSFVRLVRMVRDIVSWRLLLDALSSGAARSRLLALVRRSHASVGRNVEVVGIDNLAIGPGTVIQSNVVLQCDGHEWTGVRGRIHIGRNAFIGHGCALYGAGGISIGDDVLVSPHVAIVSHQHSFDVPDLTMRVQPTRTAPVTIDSNVWIGSGAVILPGVHLGEGCIVAAGAVVTASVPPGVIVAGVPARPMPRRPKGMTAGTQTAPIT